MEYLLGGYYLVKINNDFDPPTYTCSSCINFLAYDTWALSWCEEKLHDFEQVALKTDDTILPEIEAWADQSFNDEKVGYPDVFYSLETIREYRDRFFPDRADLVIMGIFFTPSEANDLIDELDFNNIGLTKNLKNKIAETDAGKFIGYDLIGVTSGGSFHSFACYGGQREELTQNFGCTYNEFGLLNHNSKWQQILEQLNEEDSFDVWFYVKVKMFD